MDDNNGAVNTNQGQLNPVADNHTTSPTYTATSAPFASGFNSQPPQNGADLNQNDQLSHTAIPEPTVSDDRQITPVNDSALQDIKRNALQNLLPIVGKLDQPPEERFQTLLMVIQASDNRELISEAYETAAKIQDDDKRAQALVAIINEINFFTQQSTQN
jgi:hypothetical protein